MLEELPLVLAREHQELAPALQSRAAAFLARLQTTAPEIMAQPASPVVQPAMASSPELN
jgi:hypothetical protein